MPKEKQHETHKQINIQKYRETTICYSNVQRMMNERWQKMEWIL